MKKPRLYKLRLLHHSGLSYTIQARLFCFFTLSEKGRFVYDTDGEFVREAIELWSFVYFKN